MIVGTLSRYSPKLGGQTAALITDLLAKEVDFFSIGTNDLTQYTIAVDRMNTKVTHLYDAHHPAVLRLIQMTIENGHKEGIWVGICGEAAADPSLVETFVNMGIDELSVRPRAVLEVREQIQGISVLGQLSDNSIMEGRS